MNSQEMAHMAKIRDNLYDAHGGCPYLVTDGTPIIISSGKQIMKFNDVQIYKLDQRRRQVKLPGGQSSDQIKQKIFMWIYDSKSIVQPQIRCQFLYKRIRNKFPQFGITVMIGYQSFNAVWHSYQNCIFPETQYGHYIIILLN